MPSDDPFDDPFFKEPFKDPFFDRNVNSGRSNRNVSGGSDSLEGFLGWMDRNFGRLFKAGLAIGCLIYALIGAALVTAIVLAWKHWG